MSSKIVIRKANEAPPQAANGRVGADRYGVQTIFRGMQVGEWFEVKKNHTLLEKYGDGRTTRLMASAYYFNRVNKGDERIEVWTTDAGTSIARKFIDVANKGRRRQKCPAALARARAARASASTRKLQRRAK